MNIFKTLFNGEATEKVVTLSSQLEDVTEKLTKAEEDLAARDAVIEESATKLSKTEEELQAIKDAPPKEVTLVAFTLVSIASSTMHVRPEVYEEYVERGATVREFLEENAKGKDLTDISVVSVTDASGTQSDLKLSAPLPKEQPKTIAATRRGGEFS